MSELQSVFTAVLNLSITASVALLAMALLCPMLRRAPKAVTVALWFAPLFRLLCPVSFSSVLSVFTLLGQRGTPQPVPMDIGMMARPQVDLFVPSVSHAVSQALPAATPYASVNPMQVYLFLGSVLWAAGAVALALWGVLSYGQLKLKLRTAAREGDVWRTDHAGAPFLAGLLRPRIYVPIGLSGEPLALILGHERAHLRHGDPWVKLLWYVALCVHWFNPLVWLAFRLVGRDMELHADETALKSLDQGRRALYADTLLNLCKLRRALSAPLAFGESGAAGRIRRALSYKRPAFWLVVMAAVLAVAAAVALVANPLERQTGGNTGISADLSAKLYAQRTPYIGDNSKVGAILNLLPYPDGIKLTGFELQTQEEPYGVIARMQADAGYHRYDAAELLKWENCAAALLSLVGNGGWVRFDVTGAGKDAQYLFTYDEMENVHTQMPEILNGTAGAEALDALLRGQLAFPQSYFFIQSVDSNRKPSVDIQSLDVGDDALLWKLYQSYALAPDVGSSLPSTAGYMVSFDSAEALSGVMNLYLVKDGGQALAQFGGIDEGPVRRIDAGLYDQLEALFQRLATQPVETANATAAPMGEHYELAQLSYGKEVASQTEFDSDAQYLMDSVFFDHSIRSSAWTAVDVSALETCYRIRIYLDPAQPTELYLFRKDDAACIQAGKQGMYTGLKEELFQQVAALAAKVAPARTPSPAATTGNQSLPDFQYSGDDEVLQLVYPTVAERFRESSSPGKFVISAVYVHGSYVEGDLRQVVATVCFANYTCIAGTVDSTYSMGVVPFAATYRRTGEGWELTQFVPAQDGKSFLPSIRDFCTMPVSGKPIAGLADVVVKSYSGDGNDREALLQLFAQNRQEYCRVNGLPEDTLPTE